MKISKLIISVFILVSSLFFSGCIKDEYPVKGFIVGYDPRDCMCCGGYYLNIDNNITINENSKVAGSLPAGFTFEERELPLKVQFDWEAGGGCLPENIIVKKIKRR